MSRPIIALIYVLAICTTILAEQIIHIADPVLNITSTNFDEIINSSDFAFIKFFVPWCGHCQVLAAPFHSLAVKAPNIRFGAVNCDLSVNSKLLQKYAISGFPTLKLFRNGELVDEFVGPRDMKTMEKFLTNEVSFTKADLITTLASESSVHDYFASLSNRPAIVASKECPSAIDSFQHVFNRTAHLMRTSTAKRVAFAYVSSTLNGSCVVSRRPLIESETQDLLRWDPSHEESLDIFMHVSTLQYPVATLTPENAQYVVSSSKPLLIYFHGQQDAVDSKMVDKLEDVVREGVGVVAVVADSSKFEAFRKHIGFSETKEQENAGVNGLALYFGGGPKIERHVLDPELGKESLIETVNRFSTWGLDNNATDLKSTDVSTKLNTSPHVVELTAKDWRRLIVRSNRHTLLEVYRSNCSKCADHFKALQKAAESIQTARKDLKVARIDLAQNELSLDMGMENYPGLFFVKSGEDKFLKIPKSTEVTGDHILRFLDQKSKEEDVDKEEGVFSYFLGRLFPFLPS